MKLKRSKEPEDLLLKEQIRRVQRSMGELADICNKISRSKNPALNTRALSGILQWADKSVRNLEEFESVVSEDLRDRQKIQETREKKATR